MRSKAFFAVLVVASAVLVASARAQTGTELSAARTGPLNLGAVPLTLGVTAAPSAPRSGGTFYVDKANVLHYKNGRLDYPLAGATYNGSASIGWLIGKYGVGEPYASPDDYATYQIRKNVVGTGGFGEGSFGSALVVANSISGYGAGTVALHANVAAGASTIVTADNKGILFNGAALHAAGLASGTTISRVAHGTPSAGLATITLSRPTSTAMYTTSSGSPTEIAVGVAAATEAENTITATCDTWQDSARLNTCVAGFFSSNKRVPGGTAPFGLDVVSRDDTGLGSIHAGASTIDAEFDAQASGSDAASYFGNAGIASSANGIRKGLQISAQSLGPSVDGPGVITDGVLAMLGSAATSNEPTTLTNGFRCQGIDGWGNIDNCITSDGSGAGAVGLNTTAGWVTYRPAAAAPSGQPMIVMPRLDVTVGERVSDSGGSIPAGTTVASVQEGASFPRIMVTLSANLTGPVGLADDITFANKFSDGWRGTGSFTDAFANLVNTTGPGLIKFGAAANAGAVGDLCLQGEDSTKTVVCYGDLTAAVVTNTHGATVGQLTLAPAGGGYTNIPRLNAPGTDTPIAHPATGEIHVNNMSAADTVTGTVAGVTVGLDVSVATSGSGTLAPGGRAVGLLGESNDKLAGTQGLAVAVESSTANLAGGNLANAWGVAYRLASNNGTITNFWGFTPDINNAGGTISNFGAVNCQAPNTVGTITNRYCIHNTDPLAENYTLGTSVNSTGQEFAPAAASIPSPGRYYWGVSHGAAAGTITNLHTDTYWAPYMAAGRSPLSRLGIHVTTAAAGATCRVAIYGTVHGIASGAPVHGPYTVSAAATGDAEVGVPGISLDAGIWAFGVNCSNNSVAISGYVENAAFNLFAPSTSQGSDTSPITVGATFGTSPKVAFVAAANEMPQIWARR